MKRHAPYIAAIVVLAAGLAWTGTSYLSARSRIGTLEAANQNLGHVDALIASQMKESIRAGLQNMPQTCANLMRAGGRVVPIQITTPDGVFELTRVK
ncbi:hypothetical protein R75461_01117 [Paraburkholderia nemoris]|uniref:hypothetical protein n=1 Tax=Paraburkholderia nemoris TaxID=2793076 RepID=UPI001B1A9835|nr:hypothetical protein [Paraburkholderia nemoris]CAE6712373.1 hypothetical protein R75461_01117 [Paraburkholderia nemoris]